MQKFLEFVFLQILGVLAFSAFLNLSFGFNIFARAHWRYFFDRQLDGGGVSPDFYIASLCFVLYSVMVVWFILIRPRRRIIMVKTAPAPAAPTQIQDTIDVISRPPKMNLSASFNNYSSIYNSPSPAPPAQVAPTPPAPVAAPAPQELKSDAVPEIIEILKSSGFVIGDAPKISGVQLDFWALSGEQLTIGLVCGAHGRITAREGNGNWSSDIDGEFPSPAARLYSAVESLRSLFAETLDSGMTIDISAFVVMADGDLENFDKLKPIWDAYSVRVFGHGVPEFQAFVRDSKANPINPSFEEYMNTVRWYYSEEVPHDVKI